jgi:HEAT repeat protein
MLVARCLLAVGLIALTLASGRAQLKIAMAAIATKKVDAPNDKKALESMSLKPDDPAGLVKYFKDRTLNDADLATLQSIIGRMGDENFEKRIAAGSEAEKFGAGAIGILRRTSQSNDDPEIAYRAGELLKKIEKTPHAAVASAAARALATLKPPQAAATLVAFLPMSDTKLVEEDVRAALVGLAVRDGQLEPALVAALADKSPMRRRAAVVALLNGAAANRPLAVEAAKAVRAILPNETDGETKFEATYTLATKLHDAESVAPLIELLPDATRGRLWQIEDFLLQLAGPAAPKAKMGPAKSDLEKARDEWKAWWAANRAARDLAKFEYKPTTTGNLLLLSADQVGYAQAIVGELGPDMTRKWRFGGVYCPADIALLPNGNILVLEQQYNRIMERDPMGNQVNVFNSQNYGQPFGFHKLANGNTLVAFQRSAVEYDKDWKETGKKFNAQGDDIVDVKRDAAGTTFILQRNQNNRIGKIVKLDENWKEKGTPVTTGILSYYHYRMQVLPDERILIAEQSRVAEYDLKAGKKDPVWTFQLGNAAMAERLPNGNTLVSDQSLGGIREVTPKNEVVWTFTVPDGRIALRAIRR